MSTGTVDNYRLLVRADYGELNKDVLMFIKEGWQPLGAPFSTGTCIGQAMVHYFVSRPYLGPM